MGGKQSFPVIELSKDKLVIVTGGNTGIGYETAKWIAMMGATVIIACRSEEKATTAIEKMKNEFEIEMNNIDDKNKFTDELCVEFMKVDMASLKSVKSFIDDFKLSGRKLHALVCNAGIFNFQAEVTEDGFETMFQVNYLSHFLITLHFLPIMLKAGEECRIVFVSSDAYAMGTFNKEEMERKDKNISSFGAFKIYGLSKLYQIMLMYRMNRSLINTNVTITSVHPGNVKTDIAKGLSNTNVFMIGTTILDTFGATGNKSRADVPHSIVSYTIEGTKMLGCVQSIAMKCTKVRIEDFMVTDKTNISNQTGDGMRKTPFQGAEPVINCVVNPELNGIRNTYYVDCIETPIKSLAQNRLQQDILWDYSIQCLNDYITDDLIQNMEQQEKTS